MTSMLQLISHNSEWVGGQGATGIFGLQGGGQGAMGIFGLEGGGARSDGSVAATARDSRQ